MIKTLIDDLILSRTKKSGGCTRLQKTEGRGEVDLDGIIKVMTDRLLLTTPRREPHPGSPVARVAAGDALEAYPTWPIPTCIISDGPYGLGKFPGEEKTSDNLAEWYAPHIAAWSAAATAQTTLWFWNTEVGWALVHPVLALHGWEYQELAIWDKGIQHIAGNVNSKTIRGLPVVTEVAARYVFRPKLRTGDTGELMGMKDWLRHEWWRSGLPMSRANEACGVANAATRKYLTNCHLWYMPPPEHLEAMARYCQEHGRQVNPPCFSLNGETLPTASAWSRMRAKWNHTHALTNVWSVPPVHGEERIKGIKGYLHATQKPQELMRRQITASTDVGDTVWEPFGGLCSATVAAVGLGRNAFAAEHNPQYAEVAQARVEDALQRSVRRAQ